LFFDSRVIRENLRLFFRRPIRYLRTFREAFRLGWPDPVLALRSLAVFPQAVYFARICRENGVEAVHGQWATYPAVSARIVSLLNSIPFSFTGHAHDIYLKTAGLARKLRSAAFVVTCTGENLRYLETICPGLAKGKVRVVHHGVDLSLYGPASARTSGPFRILSAGSLFECKGYEYLIAACALLNSGGFDFRCRIVGGGYLESELRRQAAAAGLGEKLQFTGYQSQAQMPGHYRWADLFILPAVLRIHWGIPNVLLEAMACGVPVACTALRSLPELYGDPPCGFVIPEEDPAAIAALVKHWAGRGGELRQYGRRGLERVRAGWDIEKTSAALGRLFGAEG
jgi:glycosyltransferase involved in cell wall biosynthesis